jgi:predicted GNAT family acetyltransferase
MTGGGSTAFVEYRRAGNTIVLTRTGVPKALSGEGVGSKMVRARSLPCGPTG